jgi:hypothetical protein
MRPTPLPKSLQARVDRLVATTALALQKRVRGHIESRVRAALSKNLQAFEVDGVVATLEGAPLPNLVWPSTDKAAIGNTVINLPPIICNTEVWVWADGSIHPVREPHSPAKPRAPRAAPSETEKLNAAFGPAQPDHWADNGRGTLVE